MEVPLQHGYFLVHHGVVGLASVGVPARLGELAWNQSAARDGRAGIVSQGFSLWYSMLADGSIWAEVFRDFGVPEEEILSYFAGPAFEAFGRTWILGWAGHVRLGGQAVDPAKANNHENGGSGDDTCPTRFQRASMQ